MTNSLLLRPHRAHRASVRACPRPRPLAIRVPTGQLPPRHATPRVAWQMPRFRTPSLGCVLPRKRRWGNGESRGRHSRRGDCMAAWSNRQHSGCDGVGHHGGRPPERLHWIVAVGAAVGRRSAGGGSCGWLDGLMRCQGIWSKQGVGTKIGYPMCCVRCRSRQRRWSYPRAWRGRKGSMRRVVSSVGVGWRVVCADVICVGVWGDVG